MQSTMQATMFLLPAERATLAALCDTLVPALEAAPGENPRLMSTSAAQLRLGLLVEEALASALDDDGRLEAQLFLRMLEQPAFNGVAAGIWGMFSGLTLEARTRLLAALAGHRLALVRRAFAGISRLALALAYSFDLPDAPNPTHEALRYRLPVAQNRRLSTSVDPLVTDAPTLTCDVLVVGSGAGGGVAAAELARAGFDVLVVEKGDQGSEREIDGRELSAQQRLYERQGAMTTADGSISILAGSTLGGGTAINWAGALRPPPELLDEWEQRFGFEGASGPEFQQSLDAVSAQLCVEPQREDAPSVNTQVFERGLRALEYNVTRIPRNAGDCAGDCGYCHFGCPTGAKQSSARAFLADAQRLGARVLLRAHVDHVLHRGGVACGALLRVDAGDGKTRSVDVVCKAVVLAAGALHTPAILLRSGLSNANIGRNLHLHPTLATAAVFAQPIRPWQGAPMTRLSAEFADLDGKGYGVRLMNAPAHPGMMAFATPWKSGRVHKLRMQQLEHTANIIAVTRDRDTGRVRLDRRGAPKVHYELSAYDARHAMVGMLEAMRVHLAAGAEEVRAPLAGAPSFRPDRGGSINDFLRDIERGGLPSNALPMFSAHQMSSARVARSPAQGAITPHGETWELKRLFVVDGSALPTCSGVNPMLTIQAVAHFLSQRIVAEL